MDSEGGMAGSERRDNWYVIKGIPVAVLLALGGQTVAFVWFLAALNGRVEVQGEKLTEAIAEWKSEMGKMNTKLDGLTTAMQTKIETIATSVQSGSVPAALNERRIADVERQLARVESRVSENERRLSSESLRNRARSER